MKRFESIRWNEKYATEPKHQQFDHHTVRFLNNFIYYLPKQAFVLDAGCGNGEKTAYLASKGLNVIGIDKADVAITYAKKTYPNLQFLVGDVTKLPFDDAVFDGVLSLAVWHCLLKSERKAFSEKIMRVLKPRGILYQLTLAAEDRTLERKHIIEERTFLQPSGLVFHLSTASELKTMFKKFRLLKLVKMKRLLNGKRNVIFLLVAKKR